jgi:hypothetical protein
MKTFEHKSYLILGRICGKTDKWLKEHPDGKEVELHELTLMFERLRTAFEDVKNTLKKVKESETGL